MGEIRYMISETARKVDVEAHVLRYWEEELELPIDRNEMGHRYYTEDDITLFKNIKELKEQGFQLKAIKMLLPELRSYKGGNMDKLLKQREKWNEAALRQETAAADGKAAAQEKAEEQTHRGTEERRHEGKPVIEAVLQPEEAREETAVAGPAADGMLAHGGTRMEQFQAILGDIILQALRDNNQELSKGISERVSDNVLKEMDYLMRVQEEREEERFKKLDESIRLTQRSRREAAAARVEEKRLKKLQKKQKKRWGLFRREISQKS